MSTYVIGDVQGCLAPLKALLEKINYDPHQDQLWFTGDLANRGPQPLATLRFIKALPNTIAVLGNHDLALLAAHLGAITFPPDETASEILLAPDKANLIHWLQHLPLLHYDPTLNVVMTHAGIYPFWDIQQAFACAKEAETVLRDPISQDFYHQMYGNEPVLWNNTLKGADRIRFIINVFTRMRYLTTAGELDLNAKDSLSQHPNLIPWFLTPTRKELQETLVFGHWASLKGECATPNIYALDEGCVWGECLAALCLETKQRIKVSC